MTDLLGGLRCTPLDAYMRTNSAPARQTLDVRFAVAVSERTAIITRSNQLSTPSAQRR